MPSQNFGPTIYNSKRIFYFFKFFYLKGPIISTPTN